MTRRLLLLLAVCAAFGVTASNLYGDASAPPPITITAPSSVTTSDPSGIDVTYSVKSHLEPAVDVTCSPEGGPGTQFSVTRHFDVGDTTISCTDTADPQNSASATVTVTYVAPPPPPPPDTTPPTLTVSGDITTQATSPAGATVSYTPPTATDDTDPSPLVLCAPASGSLFPIGSTTVTCTATDASGNSTQKSFTVTVQEAPPPPPPPPDDTTGPEFSNVPGTIIVQANGPSGSLVNYTPPTASDAIDGPAVVACAPASGSLFPLGAKNVTCTASDNHGNSSSASFLVQVVDTTPPTLIVPADASAYADSPESLSPGSYGLSHFLASAYAFDLVDPHPTVRHDVGERLSIGVHVITFIATDASGNSVSKTARFEVLPMPPPGTPPLPLPPARQPPANVTNFKATAGDSQVRLTWQIPSGVDHVVLTRALTAGGDAQEVYSGKGTSFTDRGVANGLEYRYLIVSVNSYGDPSSGVAAVVLPKRSLLRSPKDGARLKKPPKLMWTRNAEAAYYNVQLYRGQVKVLSIWPVKPALALKRSWKFQGKRYTLTRGVYRWYVWPGFGARSAVDYGELLGFRSFRITR
jgi:hypothetical protein